MTKKTILTALAVLFSAALSFAQMPGGMPTGRPGGMEGPRPQAEMKQDRTFDSKTMALHEANKLEKALSLTIDQKDKVFKAYKKFFDGLSGSMQMTEMGPQMPSEATINSYKHSLEKRMEKILNSVQFAQWQEMTAQEAARREFHGHKGHNGHGEGTGEGPRRAPGEGDRHPADGQPGPHSSRQ